MSVLAQKTISEIMDERDALQIKLDFSKECIRDLREQLDLVREERDDLVAEKRKAGFEHEDYKRGQADLAHSSGEGQR